MESSEDDAGAATNASRRVSAREKDVGKIEDVDATSSLLQGPSEPTNETPAMSEYHSDRDSVPSPSTQDVNTSTEAILDMIDEIVDGPGAPKRLNYLLENDTDSRFAGGGDLNSSLDNTENNNSSSKTLDSASATSAKINEEHNSPPCSPITESSQNEIMANRQVDCVESPQAVSSVQNSDLVTISIDVQKETVSCSAEPYCENILASSVSQTVGSVSETPSSENVDSSSVLKTPSCENILSSSVSDTVQNVSESSSCENINSSSVSQTVQSVSEITCENINSSSVLQTVESVSEIPTCENIHSSSVSQTVQSVSETSCEIIHSSSVLHTVESVREIQAYENIDSSSVSQTVKSVSDTPCENIDSSSVLQTGESVSETSSCENILSSSVSQTVQSISETPCENIHSSSVLHTVERVIETQSCENIHSSSESQTVQSVSETLYENINSTGVSQTGQSVSERPCEIIDSSSVSHIVQSVSETPCEIINSSRVLQTVQSVSETTCEDIKSSSVLQTVERVSETPSCENINSSSISQPVQSVSKTSSCENIHSSSISETVKSVSETTPCENISSLSETVQSVSETPSSENNLSSSVLQTVQSVSGTESTLKRTLKCVTSSVNRDKVVVESAESTSSDNSISEGRSLAVESVTRSPLRRRLVRPAPNRPDSTVSSTVDSSINTHPQQQASYSVVKDVSSSSDAVPTLLENTKPEEITNVSEVSICKAETSSPTKKIKLIRQKIIPSEVYIPDDNIVIEQQTAQIEPCESTSSETPIVSIKCNSEVRVSECNKSELENHCNEIPESVSNKCEDQGSDSKAESLREICHNSNEQIKVNTNVPDIEKITFAQNKIEVEKKLPPLKINLNTATTSEAKDDTNDTIEDESSNVNVNCQETADVTKHVPKLTIKLANIPTDEIKPPVPKFTIKPIKPPMEVDSGTKSNFKEQIPLVTKLNIKPITKQPERINEIHRKSSSSEISESEYSENDESNSTSDQASASDQGSSDVVPKVTIKLGKPGTESEGQFYTEKNIPKLTIKAIPNSEINEQSSPTKLKIVMNHPEVAQVDKIPKLTIKTVSKCESQPLSPKLIIKPIKAPEEIMKECSADQAKSVGSPKSKASIETQSSSESKDASHVPKITIKPVTKPYEATENIPIVTKLNIKPLVKPDNTELSDGLDDKVPVVSKLNIKPIVKPKDSEIDCSKDDVPKITKLNIKPLRSPETNSSEEKDCDVLKADLDESSIPVVTKINIKPIVKPLDEDSLRDNENQSSETGNSSDDNTDQIPIVTKINIKPIFNPNNMEESGPSAKKDDNIPVITKLNIKPLVKPDETISPRSPKKEMSKISTVIPAVTKLNIKPILKPEEVQLKEGTNEVEEVLTKNPPLVMKINRKTVVNEDQYSIDKNNEHCNNIIDPIIPVVSKVNIKPVVKPSCEVLSNNLDTDFNKLDDMKAVSNIESQEKLSKKSTNLEISVSNQNCVDNSERNSPCLKDIQSSEENDCVTDKPIIRQNSLEDLNNSVNVISGSAHKESKSILETETIVLEDSTSNDDILTVSQCKTPFTEPHITLKLSSEKVKSKSIPSRQNCTLLKKLLETRKEKAPEEETENKISSGTKSPSSPKLLTQSVNLETNVLIERLDSESQNDAIESSQSKGSNTNIISCNMPIKVRSMQELCNEANDNLTKPLEINISDKVSSQSSDQDSPRIILKINKTDQGASAKIITEESKKSDLQIYSPKNTHDLTNDTHLKKNLNSRRQPHVDTPMPMGKRLRSSRVVQTPENTPVAKRNVGKRASATEISPPQSKEHELSMLETKRLKLGQLLSNKSLTITPISGKASTISPPIKSIENKQSTRNHSILNNENCAKNGSSKLHNILSNLQAKQLQAFDLIHAENNQSSSPDLKSSTSAESPELITDSLSMDKTRPEVQMVFQDNSESHDFSMVSEERDPLEVDPIRTNEFLQDIPKPVEMTPQPKKRGRPRKLPVSEGAKIVTLPIPALEERPQRSLRLSRDRPVILAKPRGRGRGRGRRLETEAVSTASDAAEAANKFFLEQKQEEMDPTSSRVKLPRMTEALDNMPSVCSTPLSSRRRSSSEMQFFGGRPTVNIVESPLPKMEDPFLKSPEMISECRGRGSRGGRGRGGRGRPAARSPRGRGRARGGGRGAMYMKETMGIYGRVCGPATTTVQLFEEETCMMDDNATPAKPSHLLDEDSQSSVKSSTNDSNKMKKSKFADLFDSNKVWTASDVKEYMWPPPDQADGEPRVMMIQEQVAMFLNVKSFKRRYPELKRRTVTGEERDFVLRKGLVSEALCDLGITAVDASEVLDIMLSDYPHKYEEYRSHQRERQLAEPDDVDDNKIEVKEEKTDVKDQKAVDQKPDQPKIDPEKTRQDMAAAAIASASEWNARLNALRRPACADLQSLTVQRRRAPVPPPPPPRVCPPAGFYPHALLPGQYQHTYRVYTPQELRYFPLNTALAAPPAPASPPTSSSESEGEWGSRSSSSDSERDTTRNAKRKKLTKTKRVSQAEAPAMKEEEVVDTCRTCKLRLEANRKYTHERFLVCAKCDAKLHPHCVELGPDTIRKCREYAWQCAECKTCCACPRPADADKMLFCDLCDRGFHVHCVGLSAVPTGRWHCVECSICKSCGARSPSGLEGAGGGGAGGAEAAGGAGAAAEWHHQTRRGPGGHKLYSHSLCTPCARAYRIGRYCPLCGRSFIGPKGTMQLVICKLCDRQLHQDCVKSSESARLNVLDYTCGECRRGGITSRAAAVRLAPRTIATLFMAKRRFNKYAHRQYMQSRIAQHDDASSE